LNALGRLAMEAMQPGTRAALNGFRPVRSHLLCICSPSCSRGRSSSRHGPASRPLGLEMDATVQCRPAYIPVWVVCVPARPWAACHRQCPLAQGRRRRQLTTACRRRVNDSNTRPTGYSAHNWKLVARCGEPPGGQWSWLLARGGRGSPATTGPQPVSCRKKHCCKSAHWGAERVGRNGPRGRPTLEWPALHRPRSLRRPVCANLSTMGADGSKKERPGQSPEATFFHASRQYDAPLGEGVSTGGG